MSSIGNDPRGLHPSSDALDAKRAWQNQAPTDPLLTEAFTSSEGTHEAAEAAAAAELRRLLATARMDRATRAGPPPETNLGLIMPPQVELTEARRRGAKAFATSIEALDFADLGRIKLKGAPPPTAREPAGGDDAELPTTHLTVQHLMRDRVPTEGPVADDYDALIAHMGRMTNPEMQAMATEVVKTSNEFHIAASTAEALIAMFLKLQMTDKNEAPETQNLLHKGLGKAREAEIQLQKEKNEEARVKIEEARAKAENMKLFARILNIVMLALAVVLSALIGVGMVLLTMAAIGIGAIAGAAKGEEGKKLDGALEGAMWGSMAAGLVPVALAAGAVVQSARAAASAAVRQAGKTATKAAANAAEQAAKEGMEEATKQATKQATKEVAKEVTEETIEQAKTAAREAAGNAVERAGKEADRVVKEIATKTAQTKGADFATTHCQQKGLSQVYDTATKNARAAKAGSLERTYWKEFEKAISPHYRAQTNRTGMNRLLHAKLGAHGRTEPAAKLLKPLLVGAFIGMQTGKITMEHQANLANLEAAAVQVDAKTHGRLAEIYQELLEEIGMTMQQMMRAKNQSIDAVLDMMATLFGTRLKQYSAAMTGLR